MILLQATDFKEGICIDTLTRFNLWVEHQPLFRTYEDIFFYCLAYFVTFYGIMYALYM